MTKACFLLAQVFKRVELDSRLDTVDLGKVDNQKLFQSHLGFIYISSENMFPFKYSDISFQAIWLTSSSYLLKHEVCRTVKCQLFILATGAAR